MPHQNLRLMKWFNFFLDFKPYAPIAIVYFLQVTGSFASGLLIIGSNANLTTYSIYHWSAGDGWQLEKTYNFDEPAQLIIPADSKASSSFYWAFWLNTSDQLKVYKWTQENQYEKITQRDLSCNGECSFDLEISKLGKVFFSWRNWPALAASVWKPSTEVWDDVVLSVTAGRVIDDTHITSGGQWVVQYSFSQKSLIRTWSPDGGWRKQHTVSADASYFNGDKLYLADLNKTTHQLAVEKLNRSTGNTHLIDTIEEISTFHTDTSFIYNGNIFLDCNTQDNERVIETISL